MIIEVESDNRHILEKHFTPRERAKEANPWKNIYVLHCHL